MYGMGLWELVMVLAMCIVPLVIVAGAVLLVFALKGRISGPTKKCPYCAENIRAEAIVCRFCGRDVAPTATPRD